MKQDPIFRFFSSLKLTVTLLCLSIVLVFFGTLDQVNLGINIAQAQYFESFIAYTPAPALLKMLGTHQFDHELAKILVPIPGGFTLGALLLINLICAHFRHFRSSSKQLGIILTHGGVFLLIVSGFLTAFVQEEYQMWIDEGGQSNYAENYYSNEIVLIDKSAKDYDEVTSIPQALMKSGASFDLAEKPFTITIKEFYRNALIAQSKPEARQSPEFANAQDVEVTRGVGNRMDLVLFPRQRTVKDDEMDATTAIVEVHTGEELIGSWIISNVFDGNFPPQTFEHEGKTYEIAMRFERLYIPYYLHLEDFSFDRYPGTEIPRNYSSLVRILNPLSGENRQTLIYMNHPLRYEGLTFYQSSFGNNEKSTRLQVVRNPSWLLPYLAITLVGLGMTIQFGQHLWRYLSKRKKKGEAA